MTAVIGYNPVSVSYVKANVLNNSQVVACQTNLHGT